MKKKIFKKFIGTIFCCLILLSCTISAFASEIPGNSEVIPRWESIEYATVNIGFSNGICNPTGTAYKQTSATSIEGTLTLYKEVNGVWVYVDEWYKSTTRSTLAISGEINAISGVRYKAVFNVVAYTGSSSETYSTEFIKRCP